MDVKLKQIHPMIVYITVKCILVAKVFHGLLLIFTIVQKVVGLRVKWKAENGVKMSSLDLQVSVNS